MTRPTEDGLIARYFAPLATSAGADGLRDDAALVTPPPGMSLVVTADALVAGVHFLPDAPPGTIARKALRVNLSDIAAKGARPYGFTLSLALPGDWTEDWLAGFAEGLRQDMEAYDFALLGGDTIRTPGPLTIAVSAFGLVPEPRIPRRGGARPGDTLYVSGTIGDAALGLKLLIEAAPERALMGLAEVDRHYLLERAQLPQPRTALADAVLAHASAAMDISDGLVGDLTKLLAASGASATIELAAVPLSKATASAVMAAPALLDAAVTGGEDFEILCAVPAERRVAFEADAAAAGVSVTTIGTVIAGRAAPAFRDAAGRTRQFSRGGFSHF